MAVVSIIGPKGGIGKTTLSINTAAALTRLLPPRDKKSDNRVCLFDLDLRLPTISSLLDSHPNKSFYDLFETLANKTWQIDFLRNFYQIISRFQWFLEGRIDAGDENLARCLAHFRNFNAELFLFTEFPQGDLLHELILDRNRVLAPKDLTLLRPILDRLDMDAFRQTLKRHENNSWPIVEEFIKYIEEYHFSILGGEIPILGKKAHRKRINEPELLLLFLDVLGKVLKRYDYVILDTPAGGVHHLSSLINVIDQVIFVFDLSNNIAVNGSIDALHSFIDYYEDFYQDFQDHKLTGLDKAHAQRLVAERGEEAVLNSLKNKKLGIVFNRCQNTREIPPSLKKLREYLDTLDKLETYKDRIQIVGMVPHHKVINITNNRGALFYNKDQGLTGHVDQIAQSILGADARPTLNSPDKDILRFLKIQNWLGFSKKLGRIASI